MSLWPSPTTWCPAQWATISCGACSTASVWEGWIIHAMAGHNHCLPHLQHASRTHTAAAQCWRLSMDVCQAVGLGHRLIISASGVSRTSSDEDEPVTRPKHPLQPLTLGHQQLQVISNASACASVEPQHASHRACPPAEHTQPAAANSWRCAVGCSRLCGLRHRLVITVAGVSNTDSGDNELVTRPKHLIAPDNEPPAAAGPAATPLPAQGQHLINPCTPGHRHTTCCSQ